MYRWLLRLYPASFRREYGPEMLSVFARERRDARTLVELAALWTRTIADTCVNAAAVALAAAAVPLLSRLVPSALPVTEAPLIDLRVLAFTAVVTLLSGIGFGSAPLLQQRSNRASEGLRDSARAGGGQRERLRGALVGAEIAASVVLLVTCGD